MTLDDDEIDEFIAENRWTFAKSMPWLPHEYVVRERVRNETRFVNFVLHIREHGYAEQFGKRTYTYLDWGPFKYWTMGSPIEQTIIINRARKK